MRKLLLPLSVLIIVIFAAGCCDFIQKAKDLAGLGKSVEKFDEELAKLKNPDEILTLNEDVQKAGVQNVPEFYLTMGEVTTGVHFIVAQMGMATAYKSVGAAAEQMKKQLEDPNVPEEQKKAIREGLASMEKSQQQQMEKPENLTDDEMGLIKINFDRLAPLFGIDVAQLKAQQLEAEKNAETRQAISVNEEKEKSSEPIHKAGGTKQTNTQRPPKGARVK